MIKRFYVEGIHCASCEILIEKKLRKIEGVKTAEVILSNGTVEIESKNTKITTEFLNNIFATDGYRFSIDPFKKSEKTLTNSQCANSSEEKSSPYGAILMALIFIGGYIFLDKTGLSSLISVNAKSSLPIFFLFGLLAGVSSCAALVGGIVLSLSKQWLSKYSESDSTINKAQPHFLFNLGRVAGYAGFGAILGMAGNFFRLSPVASATLVIGVSLIMVLLGLQMVGVKALRNFQIKLPKSITSKMADESKFTGRFAPLLMGALTFFLPCGFTMTTQALALASGSPIQGALILGLFALGTVPGLLAIGLSSVKFQSNPKSAKQFSTVAGLLVLFFAAFNINSQLAVLGFSNFPNNQTTLVSNVGGLAPVVNGKQVLVMQAVSGGYSPNKFTVKAGIPVSWQVSNDGSAGCGASIVAQGLFPDRIDTIPGQIVTKEFTPTTPGEYRFSCAMGMYTGTITVVDASGLTGTSTTPIGSGSKGCGCGGGSAASAGTCGGGR